MRHPWRITVPAQATRHPPAKCPVRAVGRAGVRRLWRAVPKPACWWSSSQVDPRHAWMFLLPRPPATHGVALPRRSDAQTMAAQLDLSHSARVRPGQVNPRLPCLGSQPAHQPCVYGMAWVGWRDHKAPWMAPYEPPWAGSRRVPRPHPRRPATHQPEMPLLLWLWLRLHGHGHGQHQPPQPAEHLPRYTQAIASPPGPLKPCNINGLKGKSAP